MEEWWKTLDEYVVQINSNTKVSTESSSMWKYIKYKQYRKEVDSLTSAKIVKPTLV